METISNILKNLFLSNETLILGFLLKEKDKILSNGGRVLNFVIRSNNFKNNREAAINLINKINWENGFFRRDIGYKVID